MQEMKRLLLILCGLLIMVTMFAQTTEFEKPENSEQPRQATKVAADSAYLNGRYREAANIYEELLQDGESDELYYNLGNAYYKCDELARAILNYERALIVNPGFADAKANLQIARAKTIDKEIDQPEIFFITWIKQAMHCYNLHFWAISAIVTFFLFLLAVAMFFISKVALWKKIGFFSGLILLTLTVVFNLFAASLKSELTHRNKAIVLSPSITVRSTPSESGTSLFVLHEGHKVEIKDDSMREWKEISIDEDKVGWVPAESIEEI